MSVCTWTCKSEVKHKQTCVSMLVEGEKHDKHFNTYVNESLYRSKDKDNHATKFVKQMDFKRKQNLFEMGSYRCADQGRCRWDLSTLDIKAKKQ